jgi:hypothetical protein
MHGRITKLSRKFFSAALTVAVAASLAASTGGNRGIPPAPRLGVDCVPTARGDAPPSVAVPVQGWEPLRCSWHRGCHADNSPSYLTAPAHPADQSSDVWSRPQRRHAVVLNVQPVIPITLNKDWNLLSRNERQKNNPLIQMGEPSIS